MTNKELDEYLDKRTEKMVKNITDCMCYNIMKHCLDMVFGDVLKEKPSKTINVNGVSYPFDGEIDVKLQTKKPDSLPTENGVIQIKNSCLTLHLNSEGQTVVEMDATNYIDPIDTGLKPSLYKDGQSHKGD